MKAQPPAQARAVIIGAGVVGASVAYHLTKLGWRDVVVLERRQVTCGTTWHAAGLLGQLRATANMTRLAQYTTSLYRKLEDETGHITGVRQNGSLSLALNEARFEELKRGAAMGRLHGLEAQVLGPGEIAGIYPALNLEGVVGGLFLPGDGQGDPVGITQALIKGARQGGAGIFEGVKVTGILTGRGRVTGVETDSGIIEADHVVNCAGLWGREVGRMAGVSVPLMACEHFYIVTEAMAEMTPGLPVLRVADEHAYYKEDAGKLLLEVLHAAIHVFAGVLEDCVEHGSLSCVWAGPQAGLSPG